MKSEQVRLRVHALPYPGAMLASHSTSQTNELKDKSRRRRRRLEVVRCAFRSPVWLRYCRSLYLPPMVFPRPHSTLKNTMWQGNTTRAVVSAIGPFIHCGRVSPRGPWVELPQRGQDPITKWSTQLLLNASVPRPRTLFEGCANQTGCPPRQSSPHMHELALSVVSKRFRVDCFRCVTCDHGALTTRPSKESPDQIRCYVVYPWNLGRTGYRRIATGNDVAHRRR